MEWINGRLIGETFHFQNKNGDQLSIEVSVAKLNAALTEYKESQGW